MRLKNISERMEVTTTNSRIKKLRKALDLTQAEFAQKIGTVPNSVACYEMGRRNPSSSTIQNICKAFNVNEDWLRTGSGEMFLTLTQDNFTAKTIGERIKKMRWVLDIRQSEFASRIGTTQNSIANYETGHRNPSSSVINNICKTFNVDENWLRTGDGEMFVEVSRADEIASFVEQILGDESAEFKRRFVSALSRLNDAGWDALERFVDDMARQKEQESASQPDQQAIWEAEARAEAEQYYQQRLEEKKAEAGYSAFPPTDCGNLLA